MRRWGGLFVFGSLLALVLPAAAAESDNDQDEPCEHLGERQELEQPSLIAACLGPIADRESLLTISHLVHRLVANELLGGSLPGPAANSAGLNGDGTYAIAPAADTASPAPQRKWNVWADGKYSWIDGLNDTSNSHGPLINATSGIDYKITDRAVLGLLFSYENSDLKTSGPLSKIGTQTNGLGGGAYLGLTLTDHIVFSALVNGSFLDNDYDLLFSTASTDSERLQTSAGFTGYFYSSNSWRWSPSIAAAWSGDWSDSYHDTVGNDFERQTTETGILSIGSQLGRTFSFSNGASIEPWTGTILEYTFLDRTDTHNAETVAYPETVDFRYQLGLNVIFAPNVQLTLSGEAAGFRLKESHTYAGEANLAVQF